MNAKAWWKASPPAALKIALFEYSSILYITATVITASDLLVPLIMIWEMGTNF